ncbi:MAG TPA: 3-oxoacyl-[acyl-carrier-protein] synthase III C-terminal domain-containing protein [Solirubrobacteraceae bacterium]|jgi:alkylresorcinol/alkylpyrone synthase|nr:3-oxoacyl-[acyl-carrier-protein] synthase III C-terminal domain-containing protein [Solirubrobacteraceae bacterium]
MSTGLHRYGGVSTVADPIAARRKRQRGHGPRISGLALADAPTVLTQQQVLAALGLAGNAFAEGIFERCGVKQRHLNLNREFIGRTLQGRSAQIEHELLAHAVRAVEQLQIDPLQIGTVVSASLYSLGGPTLAHRLVEHFEMAPTTDKYHITGVGCASGVPLMRLASQALREHPHKQALVVAAESLSGLLTPSSASDSKAKIVGSAIFGDGCAAALLSGDARARGPAIVASQVHQIPGTLDAVAMQLSEQEGYLQLARELPDLAGAGLGEVVAGFLRHNHLQSADIDHWIVHPGGRRIIENVQSALALSDGDVATSWRALANHGNVGTPSIFYVLKDAIERDEPQPGERGLMVTIGPGVTVGLMLLGW